LVGKTKILSVEDVVAEVRDGMTVGIGGWGARRKPMALVRALCASDVRDLTVVSFGGPDVGLLCSAGKVKKLVYGFASLDVIALEPHFRRAREAGEIEAVEYDEGMLVLALRAAAWRLPFLPTRAGLASDIERINPDLRRITSPYEDRETLLAVPALELDVAFVHANHADARGNTQILGTDPYFDDLFAQASRRCYVSCERIVSSDDLPELGCIHTLVLHRGLVDGVVEAPCGAHPTWFAPEYGLDREHLGLYAEAVTPELWSAYQHAFLSSGPDGYLAAIGGPDRVARLPQTVVG
jgi:acyl CoA:acetate/3-ketoacid CoA transferase alpha subunit